MLHLCVCPPTWVDQEHMHVFRDSKNSSVSISTLDFLRNELDERAKLKIKSAIRTEFNLSSKVFANIASSIGINTSNYESRSLLSG